SRLSSMGRLPKIQRSTLRFFSISAFGVQKKLLSLMRLCTHTELVYPLQQTPYLCNKKRATCTARFLVV
ncbi:MAG: hypothetical protein RML95_14455, partial [Anaerolineae bacterium]|nr:hypothetical protein [Anaerolineae bacterium]